MVLCSSCSQCCRGRRHGQASGILHVTKHSHLGAKTHAGCYTSHARWRLLQGRRLEGKKRKSSAMNIFFLHKNRFLLLAWKHQMYMVVGKQQTASSPIMAKRNSRWPRAYVSIGVFYFCFGVWHMAEIIWCNCNFCALMTDHWRLSLIATSAVSARVWSKTWLLFFTCSALILESVVAEAPPANNLKYIMAVCACCW